MKDIKNFKFTRRNALKIAGAGLVSSAVVRVTFCPACNALLIFVAIAESITRSNGSMSHIPPLPALIEANKAIAWPEVSIKPPCISSCD